MTFAVKQIETVQLLLLYGMISYGLTHQPRNIILLSLLVQLLQIIDNLSLAFAFHPSALPRISLPASIPVPVHHHQHYYHYYHRRHQRSIIMSTVTMNMAPSDEDMEASPSPSSSSSSSSSSQAQSTADGEEVEQVSSSSPSSPAAKPHCEHVLFVECG